MTNLEMIAQTFASHSRIDINATEKLIARINNNFNLHSDEVIFSLDCRFHRPYSDLFEEAGKMDTDSNIGADLKINIGAKVIGKSTSMSLILDQEGIKSMVVQGKKNFKSVVVSATEQWLDEEFGKL